jgi:THO complex subunit 2
MPEQERIANEEAEKRLKAKLAAKKPMIAASRTASPGVGAADTPVDLKPAVQDSTSKEDVPMEAEPTSLAAVPPTPEVTSYAEPQLKFLHLLRVLGCRN